MSFLSLEGILQKCYKGTVFKFVTMAKWDRISHDFNYMLSLCVQNQIPQMSLSHNHLLCVHIASCCFHDVRGLRQLLRRKEAWRSLLLRNGASWVSQYRDFSLSSCTLAQRDTGKLHSHPGLYGPNFPENPQVISYSPFQKKKKRGGGGSVFTVFSTL